MLHRLFRIHVSSREQFTRQIQTPPRVHKRDRKIFRWRRLAGRRGSMVRRRLAGDPLLITYSYINPINRKL